MNYRNIIIGSAPRTGGMWTYNVIREIFVNQKKNIIPLSYCSDDEMLKHHLNNLNSHNDIISIIKIHKIIKKQYTNKTKIVINIRDPRDAVISYKRFMKLKNYSFQQTIKFINNSIDLIYYYRKNYNKEKLLEINFNDITDNPHKIFTKLEKFLYLKINKKMVNKIIEKFSKKKVSEIIEKMRKTSKSNLVALNKNTIRKLDEKTGFQIGHVSDYKEGDWQQHFSDKEILDINNKLEELSHQKKIYFKSKN